MSPQDSGSELVAGDYVIITGAFIKIQAICIRETIQTRVVDAVPGSGTWVSVKTRRHILRRSFGITGVGTRTSRGMAAGWKSIQWIRFGELMAQGCLSGIPPRALMLLFHYANIRRC